MKHIGRVSKALPAVAASPYQVPRNFFDIMSWTDIVTVIGLTMEKWAGWLFGSYLLPEGLLNIDRNGNDVID